MGCLSHQMIRAAFLAVFCVALSQPAEAKIHRNHHVLREFQKAHPCPSTGRQYGSCPGWIKDHVQALACGGADAVDNLQWQTVAEAKAKDRWERKGCAR